MYHAYSTHTGFISASNRIVLHVAFSSTLPDAAQDQSFRTTGELGNFLAATDQAGDPATD